MGHLLWWGFITSANMYLVKSSRRLSKFIYPPCFSSSNPGPSNKLRLTK